MKRISTGRRAMLAALSVWAFAGVLPAAAQDPKVSQARAALADWLALADANDVAKTYSNSAQRFRASMTVEQWTEAMKRAREQFGPTVSRTFVGSQVPQPGKNTPPGEFVVIAYRTEFAKRAVGTETVTMEREADGKWRVVGYLMR
jgi:hypothetical protein